MPSRLFRLTILALTFCTGFSGLVYEVVWHAYLSNMIGSQARSAAIIVAVFLGGLSLGYALFGKTSLRRSPSALLAIYGIAELLIGFWAIAFPSLYALVTRYNNVWEGVPGLGGDVLRCLLLIALPTTLMGGTLPLLTQALANTLKDSAALHARIYAINTAGAFLGCLSAGFVILPALGLPVTVMAVGFINVFAGLIIFLMARSFKVSLPHGSSEELPQSPPLTSGFKGFFAAALFVSFAAGFISISLQMIVMRLIGLSAGSSQYSFSMAVSAFILMLAVGAWRLSEHTRRPIALWKNQALVAAGIALILLSAPLWPYASHVTRILLTSVPVNFVTYHLALFTLLSLIIAPAVGAMGNTLPALFRIVQTDLQSLGSRVGWLYGVNTLGCVLGALIGGYLVFYYLDFPQVLLLLATGSICTIVVASLLIERTARLRSLLLACILGIVLTLIPRWPVERFGIGIFRMKSAMPYSFSGPAELYRQFLDGSSVLAYKDDPNTTIAVKKGAMGGLSILVNGKSDGSTGGSDRITTKLLAHLPMMLNRTGNERVAIIGYGTGLTAGTAALYPSIKQVDVIEIAPFIRTFAPLFDFANNNSSQNPRIQWHIQDAYRFLTRASTTDLPYDAIISEPSNPWVAGVERLYAQEFYRIVRNRLAPGGVYAQWFHSYSISRDTLALVLNTFHRSWPSVRVFINDMDLILVGSDMPLNADLVPLARQRLESAAVANDLKQISLPTLEALLATEIMMPPRSYRDGAIQTLDFPKLSHQAGYDFFLDTSIIPETFAEDMRWRDETFALWNDSLLNRAIIQGQGVENIATVASSICHTNSPSLSPGWRKLGRGCRLALMAAAAKGAIESVAPDADEIIELLRRYSTTQPSTHPRSVDRVAQELRTVSEYVSPWYQPETALLRELSLPCFEHESQEALGCQLLTAQIALWSGKRRESAEYLKRVPLLKLSRALSEVYHRLASRSFAEN